MASPHLFELVVTGLDAQDLFVLSLRGREETNRPYRFDLVVESTAHDLEARLCGSEAQLTLHSAGGEARVLRGVIERIRVEDFVVGSGRTVYRLRLVHRLSTLRLSKNTRIFQDLSVPEIVDAVLEPRGIARSWRVTRAYPKRDYRVQYAESDLAFVTRLLAEEGIHYFIEPGEERDVVVFGDIAEHVRPLTGGTLPFTTRDDRGASREGIHGFALRRALRPEDALLAGYDMLRPALRPSGRAELAALKQDADRERSADPGRRVYDHAHAFEPFGLSDEAARVALEQHRRDARIGEGLASTPRLFPGVAFSLVDHPVGELNRTYAVARIEHEGKQGGSSGAEGDVTYACRFACVPADVPLRPKRPKRVMRQLLDSATVVGPAGEEIHVDEHGRVKVQFHWDRDGQGDDRSSCWIRAVAPWAGATWGFQFIPRVGMEVIIGCLGGDPDRPILLGAAYNGTHAPPFPLPEHKTQSGIRTQSSPGPGGYNELRFEDAAHREQVLLKAQRDFEEQIGHDHLRRVGNDERIQVANTRAIDVDGDNIRTIKGNEVVTIEKNFVLHVFGRQQIVIEGGGAGGPNTGEAPDASAVAAAAGPESALQKADGQPAASAVAAAAAAKVNFLVEQLPDEAYDDGEKLRALVSAQKGASDELFSEVNQLRESYARIVAEAPAPGEGLPAAAVLEAGFLRQRAALTARGVDALIAVVERAGASELPDEPVELVKAYQAARELSGALLPSIRELKKAAQLVEQMAGTVVESDGAVVPIPRTRGAGSGGGGGDNVLSEANGGSEMTIKGAGVINAKDGLKLVTGSSVIEMTPEGIKLTGTKITIEATGDCDVKGHPIKLNC